MATVGIRDNGEQEAAGYGLPCRCSNPHRVRYVLADEDLEPCMFDKLIKTLESLGGMEVSVPVTAEPDAER